MESAQANAARIEEIPSFMTPAYFWVNLFISPTTNEIIFGETHKTKDSALKALEYIKDKYYLRTVKLVEDNE